VVGARTAAGANLTDPNFNLRFLQIDIEIQKQDWQVKLFWGLLLGIRAIRSRARRYISIFCGYNFILKNIESFLQHQLSSD